MIVTNKDVTEAQMSGIFRKAADKYNLPMVTDLMESLRGIAQVTGRSL